MNRSSTSPGLSASLAAWEAALADLARFDRCEGMTDDQVAAEVDRIDRAFFAAERAMAAEPAGSLRDLSIKLRVLDWRVRRLTELQDGTANAETPEEAALDLLLSIRRDVEAANGSTRVRSHGAPIGRSTDAEPA